MKALKYIFIILGGVVLIFAIFVVSLFLQSGKQQFVNEGLAMENKLVIPPLLEPGVEGQEKIFDLKIQEGEKEFFPGQKAQTWGFNGSYLGPTLRLHTGDTVRMNVINNLGEETTVHWHGMHLPAKMDGGPHQTIEPGQTWEPNWKITNEAATLWYHPHQMEKTGQQVYKGLAGFFIIDDENSDSLNIPKEYGIDDIPLVIQDRKFDENGQLIYDHNHMMHEVTAGMLGDTILVNGTRAPYLDVPAKLVRLRLLNGSNARRYNFGFSDKRVFHQIAADGGLLDSPVELTRIQLAPGERAEILVDMSGVQSPVTLMSYPVQGDQNAVRKFGLKTIAGETDENQQFKILELRTKKGDFAKQEIPEKLNEIKRFNPADAVKTRTFRLDTAAINGKKMDSSRIDEVVRKGDIEIWDVRNDSPIYHPFHIHGVQFQVLERNGQKPGPSEQGWKDTISLNPEEKVRLIMQFNDYSDPSLPFMFHCHVLEHEDMGMMGQFVVIDKEAKEEDIRINAPVKEDPHNMHMQ